MKTIISKPVADNDDFVDLYRKLRAHLDEKSGKKSRGCLVFVFADCGQKDANSACWLDGELSMPGAAATFISFAETADGYGLPTGKVN